MKITKTRIKRIVENVVRRKLQEHANLAEAFSSPALSTLWKLIKTTKTWSGDQQRDFFYQLRKPQHLGKIAFDKIPPDAVEKLSPAEAVSRKDAINIWVTTKDRKTLNTMGIKGKGYNDIALPILAVTRGKKALWVVGGESKSTGYKSRDTRMGGMGSGDVSFKSISPAVDYVISIDIVKAKMTDTSDLVSKRRDQKAGALRAATEYKKRITKYITADKSMSGSSYTFVKDAYRGVAQANKQRYKDILAARTSKQGTGPADKLVRLAMEISQELTKKFVDEKPKEPNRGFGSSALQFNTADGYGFNAKDVMYTMSDVFYHYQYVIQYHNEMQTADTSSREYKSLSNRFKDNLNSLKAYTDKMVKFRKSIKTA